MAGEETSAYSIQRNFLSLLNEYDNIPLSNPFGTGVYGPGQFLSTKTTSYRYSATKLMLLALSSSSVSDELLIPRGSLWLLPSLATVKNIVGSLRCDCG